MARGIESHISFGIPGNSPGADFSGPLPGQKKNAAPSNEHSVGKTTVIRAVLERVERPARGFYTQEIRENREPAGFFPDSCSGGHPQRQGLARVGFSVNLLSGPTLTLARVNVKSRSGQMLAKENPFPLIFKNLSPPSRRSHWLPTPLVRVRIAYKPFVAVMNSV